MKILELLWEYFRFKLLPTFIIWFAAALIFLLVSFLALLANINLGSSSKIISVFEFYDIKLPILICFAVGLCFVFLWLVKLGYSKIASKWTFLRFFNLDIATDDDWNDRFHDEAVSQITGMGSLLFISWLFMKFDTSSWGPRILQSYGELQEMNGYMILFIYAYAAIWFLFANYQKKSTNNQSVNCDTHPPK